MVEKLSSELHTCTLCVSVHTHTHKISAILKRVYAIRMSCSCIECQNRVVFRALSYAQGYLSA